MPIKSNSLSPFYLIIESNSSRFIVSYVLIITLNLPVKVNIELSVEGIAMVTPSNFINI